MRIEAKLAVLRKFTKDNRFILPGSPIMNQERVVVSDWQEVLSAIRVLREVEWAGEDDQSQLLDDYVQNRHDAEMLELSMPEFDQLQQAIQRYDDGMHILFAVLEGHAIDLDPSTIWVELMRTADPNEMALTIERMAGIFTRASQAGEAFRFVGVTQGSDWFGFTPTSELMGVVINYCIRLSASVLTDLQRMPDALVRSVIALLMEGSEAEKKSAAEASEEMVAEAKTRIKEDLVAKGAAKFKESLAEKDYPETTANQVHTAVRATTRGILELTEEGRAVFEPAENSNIIISIGDGAKVEVRNLIINSPKELPPSTE